jgi:hypothetical protein
MPFFPGAQLAYETIAQASSARSIEVQHDFLHSSDLDRSKPINWKRQARYCGAIGVMGDLGMHVAHLPLRLGWRRPPSTPSSATSSPSARPRDRRARPVRHDRQRHAAVRRRLPADPAHPPDRARPHEHLAHLATGMDGGVSFSTAQPKTVHRFALRDGRQVWERFEVGSQSAFATITGPIFEFGFADAILQMWAAYLAERAGALGDRFAAPRPRGARRAPPLRRRAALGQTHRAEPV